MHAVGAAGGPEPAAASTACVTCSSSARAPAAQPRTVAPGAEPSPRALACATASAAANHQPFRPEGALEGLAMEASMQPTVPVGLSTADDKPTGASAWRAPDGAQADAIVLAGHDGGCADADGDVDVEPAGDDGFMRIFGASGEDGADADVLGLSRAAARKQCPGCSAWNAAEQQVCARARARARAPTSAALAAHRAHRAQQLIVRSSPVAGLSRAFRVARAAVHRMQPPVFARRPTGQRRGRLKHIARQAGLQLGRLARQRCARRWREPRRRWRANRFAADDQPRCAIGLRAKITAAAGPPPCARSGRELGPGGGQGDGHGRPQLCGCRRRRERPPLHSRARDHPPAPGGAGTPARRCSPHAPPRALAVSPPARARSRAVAHAHGAEDAAAQKVLDLPAAQPNRTPVVHLVRCQVHDAPKASSSGAARDTPRASSRRVGQRGPPRRAYA